MIFPWVFFFERERRTDGFAVGLKSRSPNRDPERRRAETVETASNGAEYYPVTLVEFATNYASLRFFRTLVSFFFGHWTKGIENGLLSTTAKESTLVSASILFYCFYSVRSKH